MAVWNIINRTDFRRNQDIMAEHYQEERINAESRLKACSSYRVKDLFQEIIQLIPPTKQDENWNIYDLSDSIANFLTTEYHYTKSSSAKKIVQENDFVISRLRYYLKEMAVVPQCSYKMALSTEYLVFRPLQKIPATILLPFALSSNVQKILKWSQTGNEHPRFESETFKEIYIPNSIIEFSSELDDSINDAIKLQTLSQSLYRQAEDLLSKELKLNQLNLDSPKCYTSSYSEIASNNRFDGEFYQPKYKILMQLIDNYGGDLIGNAYTINERNYCPIPNVIYKYIELANICGNGEIKDCTIDLGKNLPSRARRIVHTGDIIISSIEGSLQSCAVITEDYNNALCSNGFFVLTPKLVSSGTSLVLFKSFLLQLLMKKICSGTILTGMSPSEFVRIKVPIIEKNIQETIDKIIVQSNLSLKAAQSLLTQAKARVEELIEQEAQNS